MTHLLITWEGSSFEARIFLDNEICIIVLPDEWDDDEELVAHLRTRVKDDLKLEIPIAII